MASAISRKKLRCFAKLTVEENILAVLEAQPISWHERREKMEKFIDELGTGTYPPESRIRPVRGGAPARGNCSLPVHQPHVYFAG